MSFCPIRLGLAFAAADCGMAVVGWVVGDHRQVPALNQPGPLARSDIHLTEGSGENAPL